MSGVLSQTFEILKVWVIINLIGALLFVATIVGIAWWAWNALFG